MAKKQADSSLLKYIQDTSLDLAERNVGTVLSFGDGVIRADGLDQARAGELIDLGENQFGLTLNLEAKSVGIVALGDVSHLHAGSQVSTTGQILSLNVSEDIIGRVIDPLGRALDGRPEISTGKLMRLERIAPGVMSRQSVSQPLQTGIKAIDAMIPIGRGQRELIIGDRGTGKSAIALGTILNQADQNIICVYVAIGQKRSTLAQVKQTLEERGAMSYTTIVSASASEPASMQFLAPYAGVAVAEYFLDQGKDVLVVYDDLTKHAQAYREISLLLRRPSGREAYPGDVFYLHSRLLERACRLNKDHGGGSITALPIIETQGNDVSAFVPTNVISITDGQIYLEADLFNAGMKPAINVGISVSRVGSAAQIKAMKQVAGTMKLDLSQFRELQAFSQFSSDLDEKTKAQLDRGTRVNAVLKQGWDQPLKVEEQVVIIFAAVNGYLDKVREDKITTWEKEYLSYIQNQQSDILKNTAKEQKMTDDTIAKLKAAIETFNDLHQDLMMEA
jgi:F-type H+/Na+-transporting ATPase subunit alpha